MPPLSLHAISAQVFNCGADKLKNSDSLDSDNRGNIYYKKMKKQLHTEEIPVTHLRSA